jgi:hypothetical protein
VQYILCKNKNTMYTIPNERLISVPTREHRAAMQLSGSFSVPWIWNTVRIALFLELVSSLAHKTNSRKEQR